MKFVFAFACMLVVAYGMTPEVEKHLKDKLLKFCVECRAEVGASEDDIEPLLNHEPPTTEKGKCVLACMHKKMGMQDESGKISKDGSYAAIEKLKPLDEELYGKMKQVADVCLSEVTDTGNECETATLMYICAKKQEKLLGIEPLDLKS